MQQFVAWLFQSTIFLPFFLILGSCIGSFLNAYAWRKPQMMQADWCKEVAETFELNDWPIPLPVKEEASKTINLSYPASHCTTCKTPITWKYNIPILGWIFLRGKAACCKAKISIRYPFFEALCGILTALTAYHFQSNPAQACGYILILWILLAISMVDLESFLIPDSLILALGTSLLFMHLLAPNAILPVSITSALWGSIVGFFGLETLRRTASFVLKKEAMGAADPKLLGIIGLMTGPIMLLWVILIASISAIIITGITMGIKRSQPIPFGPYLAIGGWIALCFYGPLLSILMGR